MSVHVKYIQRRAVRRHTTRARVLLTLAEIVLSGAAALASTFTYADPTQVTLVGVFPSKAVLVVGKGVPHTIAAGDTLDGVRLLAVTADSATVEVDGTRRLLHLGQHYAGTGEGSGRTVLSADRSGHFFAEGRINGATMRFMVDTGATVVALPGKEAERIGVHYQDGARVAIATANGVTAAYRIRLDQIVVGGISMNNVDAVVVEEGDLAMPLLGMSFLSRTNMLRDGETMTLVKRF